MYDCKFNEETGILTIDDGVENVTMEMIRGIPKSKIKKVEMSNTVRAIEEFAFAHCENLEEVEFNEGLLSIGPSAFDNCKKIKEINFPNSLKKIGKYSFNHIDFEKIVLPRDLQRIGDYDSSLYCGKVNKVIIYPENKNFEMIDEKFLVQKQYYEKEDGKEYVENKLIQCLDADAEKIVVPNEVTSLGAGVFVNFNAKEIILPNNITSIGRLCFAKCKNLKSLKIPNEVKCLRQYLFDRSGIEEIYLGDNISEISVLTFDRTDSLKKIYLSKNNTHFKTDENNSMIYSKDALFRSTEGKFPSDEDIKHIAVDCFANADFEELEVPNSVTFVDARVFRDCKNLKKVTFGDNLQIFNGFAFAGCSELKEFFVSEGNSTFCANGNTGLYKKVFDAKDEKDYVNLVIGTKHTILPENCNGIGIGAFSGVGITKICSTKDVTNLTKVKTNSNKNEYVLYLPEGIKEIQDETFADCMQLTEIDLKNSNIDNICRRAFYGCDNLEKISLPNGVKIESGAFDIGHEKENKIKEISIPIDAKFDKRNQLMQNIAINENIKCVVRFGDEEIEIKSPIKGFNHNQNVITENEIIFQDEIVDNETGKTIKEIKKLPIDYYKEYDKPFNKLNNIEKRYLHRIYSWIREGNKAGIPSYFVVENLKPQDISNFYSNIKLWQNVFKKANLRTDEEKGAFFKACVVFGLFNKSIKEANSAQTFIEKAILPTLTGQDIVRMFGECDTYRIGFNPKFDKLFRRFFVKKNQGTEIKKADNTFETYGRSFLTKTDYSSGKINSIVHELYNDFEKLEKRHSNKRFEANTGGGYSQLSVDDILDTYGETNFDDIVRAEEREKFIDRVKETHYEENGEAKAVKVENAEEIFDNFVRVLEENNETQDHFVKLADVFAEGIINWETKANERLLCREDESKDATIKYSVLDKKDDHQAVEGILIGSCLRVGNNGGGCLEYGMKMPNSRFVEFRYKGELIAESWVWYDKETKQLTLDNIDTKNIVLNIMDKDASFEIEIKNCLSRLCDGFKAEMGDKVEKITAGVMTSAISLNGYYLIPKEEMKELSNYKENLCKGFGPEGKLNKAYSDAAKDRVGGGQALLADYTKKLDSENGRNLND